MRQNPQEARCQSPRQAFKKPRPGEPHRMCLIPPAAIYENSHEMLSTAEAHQRLRAQSFYWGLVTQVPSAWQIPRFRTSRRKASIQHKQPHLYRQSRYGKLCLLFRESFMLVQKIVGHLSSLMPAKGQPSKQVFLRMSDSGLLC